jgi:hypothetical protein
MRAWVHQYLVFVKEEKELKLHRRRVGFFGTIIVVLLWKVSFGSVISNLREILLFVFIALKSWEVKFDMNSFEGVQLIVVKFEIEAF